MNVNDRIAVANDRVVRCSRIVFLLILCFLTSEVCAQLAIEVSGKTMGPIQYRVVVGDNGKLPSRQTLAGWVQGELDQVNELMSTYRDDSDVTRFNRSQSTDWFPVDPLTARVVKRSLEISELTDGAFDITIGPAVNLWSFGPEGMGSELPTDQQVADVLSIVGYSMILVREEPPAIRKKKPGVQIDLSAIAKGFAVDQVAERLNRGSLVNYMVEVGGEVRTDGVNPEGDPWKIGIEKPTANVREVLAVTVMENSSLATSGDYRNFRIIDGQKYTHTIDPRTCRPVRYGLASASLIQTNAAPNGCMTADAFATALMVTASGQNGDSQSLKKRCLNFCENHQADGFFVLQKNPDANTELMNWETFSTASFPMAAEAPGRIVSQPSASRSIWPAFLGALLLFGLAIAAMAVGAIFANKPITGSCGGIAVKPGEEGGAACSLCSKPVAECPEQQEPNGSRSV